jgi:hypothetical protein
MGYYDDLGYNMAAYVTYYPLLRNATTAAATAAAATDEPTTVVPSTGKTTSGLTECEYGIFPCDHSYATNGYHCYNEADSTETTCYYTKCYDGTDAACTIAGAPATCHPSTGTLVFYMGSGFGVLAPSVRPKLSAGDSSMRAFKS